MNNIPFLSEIQILPPFNNDVKFEEFIVDLFNNIEKTNSYDRFGRSGQKQYGLDLFSYDKKTVIQCKLKVINRPDDTIRRELISEINSDYKEFLKFQKSNNFNFNRIIFASTFKSDSKISTHCIRKATDNLIVEYWSWAKIQKQFTPEIISSYYKDFFEPLANYYFPSIFKTRKKNISINNSLPVLSQLYQYLSENYKEIKFIPIHILKSNFPFKVDNAYYPHYSVFNLSTDNDELYNFFNSLKFETDGSIIFTDKTFINKITNSQKKVKYVLNKLSNNLIFNIDSKKNRKIVNIRYLIPKNCDCPKCNFDSFKFNTLFTQLSTKPRKLDEIMRMAYVHYQLGNFFTSAKLFIEASKTAQIRSFQISYFIAQYNLSKLSIFIRNQYWKDKIADNLYKSLKQIEIDKKLTISKTPENEKLLLWIKNSNFFTEAKDEIQNHVNKIRDHYYSQLNGGKSNNNTVWQLINEYAAICSFLNSNLIIYDSFNEFVELSSTFIEGVLASHAIDISHESRLTVFDDWLLQKMFYYGNSDEIKKYFYRYKLKELNYNPTSKDGDSFIDLASNFLENDTSIILSYKENCEKESYYFRSKYVSLFDNLMVLLGICKLSKKQVNEVSLKILYFVKNNVGFGHSHIKRVEYFLRRKHELINLSILKKFLILSIEDQRFIDTYFFESIVNIIVVRKGTIKLTKLQVEKINQISFGKGLHLQLYVVHISRIISGKLDKDQFNKSILNSLTEKFNAELYYDATIFNIIKKDDDLFDKYFEIVRSKISSLPIYEPFSSKPSNKHPLIFCFFNLCFKFEININDKKYDCFKGIDKYYDWLIDPVNFNHRLFEPEWICEYQTKYFFKYLSKFSIVKQNVCEYLKDNTNGKIENAYFNIYFNKIGEKE